MRKILLGQTDLLARNLTERLMVYATGEGIQFADRKVVQSVIENTRDDGHGFRSLIHAVVQSDTFQNK